MRTVRKLRYPLSAKLQPHEAGARPPARSWRTRPHLRVRAKREAARARSPEDVRTCLAPPKNCNDPLQRARTHVNTRRLAFGPPIPSLSLAS